jgi:hypothetical protein
VFLCWVLANKTVGGPFTLHGNTGASRVRSQALRAEILRNTAPPLGTVVRQDQEFYDASEEVPQAFD